MTSEQRKLLQSIDLPRRLQVLLEKVAAIGPTCIAYQENLAAAMHCSVRSIQRNLGELRSMGLVEGRRRGSTSAEYRVCWEAISEAADPTKWRIRPDKVAGLTRQNGVSDPTKWRVAHTIIEPLIEPPLRGPAEQASGGGGGKLFSEEEKPKPTPRTTEGREQAEVVGLIEAFYAVCGPLWRASRYGQASLANRGPRPEPGGHVRPAEVDLLVDAWVEHSPEVLRAAMRELPKRLLAQFPSCKQLVGARPYLAELIDEIKRRWASQAEAARQREADQAADRERRARDALEAAERREALDRLRAMPANERAALEETMPAFVRRQSIAVQEMWLVTQMQRPVQAELFSPAREVI